ncbi:MAG: GTPase HflX [Defluviitaleaceae bacterium]|nr:GTPase HflX [Defluviitaleaceae bacterium]
MYETAERKERFILIAVEKDGVDSETNLDELSLLVETAGAETVGRIIQKRDGVHPGHYFGKGKIDEVMALVDALDADAVVADDELSPAQQRNLAQRLNVKVLDRTMVILDIFAQRAQTAEGRAQVELAQLKYTLSHLSGIGISLSRQGGVAGHGGVGNRGPGEKKLELDRRYIRSRIDQLNKELKELRENRALLRKKRTKQDIPVVALVGYTNAGKSTLLNALTGAGVLAENKLFATLDTTTRKTILPDGGAEILLTDTVGFINKLPHHLIQAFRATLEETRYADILLHVVDASSPQHQQQMETVYETLKSLDCLDKPIVTAFNKMDAMAPDAPIPTDTNAAYTALISAQEGTNIPVLLQAIEKVLDAMRSKMAVLIPYSEGALVSLIHAACKVLAVENREDGTYMEIYATDEIAERAKPYLAL